MRADDSFLKGHNTVSAMISPHSKQSLQIKTWTLGSSIPSPKVQRILPSNDFSGKPRKQFPPLSEKSHKVPE